MAATSNNMHTNKAERSLLFEAEQEKISEPDNPELVKKTLPLLTAQPDNSNNVCQNMSNNNSVMSLYAERTVPNVTEYTEEVAENICAKSYNRQRKRDEDFVKWENPACEQNTWVPKLHLNMVPDVLEIAEAQLKETHTILNAEMLKNGETKAEQAERSPKLPVFNNGNSGMFKYENEETKTHKASGIVRKNGAAACSPNEKNSAEIIITPKGNFSGIIWKSLPQIQQSYCTGGVEQTNSSIPRTIFPFTQRTSTGDSVQCMPTTSTLKNPGARLKMKRTHQTQVNEALSDNVAANQKLLRLSKAGILKVTKYMATEDSDENKMQQLCQQQQQQQSQLNIQKSAQSEGQNQCASIVAAISSANKQMTKGEHKQQVLTASEEQQNNKATEKLVLQQQASGEMDCSRLIINKLYANDDGSPILVKEGDGTIYQVAGNDTHGQVILVTQGPDGEQQFAYVAPTDVEESQAALLMDSVVVEAEAQSPLEQLALDTLVAAAEARESDKYLKEITKTDGTIIVGSMSEQELQQQEALAAAQQEGSIQANSQLCIFTQDIDVEANIPANVVLVNQPSPDEHSETVEAWKNK